MPCTCIAKFLFALNKLAKASGINAMATTRSIYSFSFCAGLTAKSGVCAKQMHTMAYSKKAAWAKNSNPGAGASQPNDSKQTVYSKVTEAIIARLDQGVIPWRQPWQCTAIAPKNAFTHKAYRGINALLLSGFEIPQFVTYHQAKEMGGTVKKGAKSLPVVFWDVIYKAADGSKVDRSAWLTVHRFTGGSTVRFARYYNVFNVKDVDGITVVTPTAPERDLISSISHCDELVSGYATCPAIRTAGSEAYYSPVMDMVTMPKMEHFDSAEFYYAVLFHELVHSTGAANRLNRPGVAQVNTRDKVKYSFEELIAEFGSAFMCASANIDKPQLLENTVSYIQGWRKYLAENPNAVLQAASAASKAANYIMNVVPEPEPAS
jgi:antirestriction protein ArdC